MKIVSNMIEAHVFRYKNGKLEFLLLKRGKKEIYPGLWQMVTGKIEKSEKAFETALREIKEETGLATLKLWVVPNVNVFYSHENDYMSLLPVFTAQVKWNSKVTISREHVDFMWADLRKTKKLLAWPGQRKSAEIISNYILKEINFLNFVEIIL
jgi:dihydroneopterin triphosphate diphosphatase